MLSQDAGKRLLPIPDLLSSSWRLFTSRWTLLMSVAAAGAVATLAALILPFIIPIALWGILPHWILIFAAACAGILGALWFSSWTPIAMFVAVLDESAHPLSFKDCWSKSYPKIVPFSWAYILFSIFVVSGFCFFLVPGVYLGVCLCLTPLVCVAQGDGGILALEKSLYYVRGRWWEVFGRLIVIGFIGFIPGIIPFIGWVAAALLSSFPMSIMAVLYHDLRRVRESDAPFASSRKTRTLLASSLIGLVFPIMTALMFYRVVSASAPDFEAEWQSLAQRQGLGNSYMSRQWFKALREMKEASSPQSP
ncbi:MAG: hypothetical protein ACYCPQ_05985 [Elusimicrobiota bacterium]